MLIINEAIDTFKTDKTDDNILMILTIIDGCIENISSKYSENEKKIGGHAVVIFGYDDTKKIFMLNIFK